MLQAWPLVSPAENGGVKRREPDPSLRTILWTHVPFLPKMFQTVLSTKPSPLAT